MKFGHKMGQAKQRKTASAKIFDDLQEQFSKEDIDTALFGFYDQPAFLKQEQKNAEFLHSYAKWVMYRPITDVYREKAISIVPKVAELVAQILKEDHIEGGCIAAAGLITRILDRLGVWSFGLSGSANFETINPRIWRGLHSVDFLDPPSAASDHAWVCAPPFYIVDASANTQRWGGQRD